MSKPQRPSPAPHHPPHHPRRGWRDWFDLIIADHGFLRLRFDNLHEIRPGVWRSAQPTPARVRAAAAAHGIRTVVNLRGARSDGGWRLVKEACDSCGIALVDFTIRSRAVPDREVIQAAHALFRKAEYPILMHCKSGADRTGIMAALYLLLMEGVSAKEAAGQLALKYGHIRQAKTGLLDAFLAAYAEAEADGTSFTEWVEAGLDPDTITAGFHANRWANILTDSLLRRE